MACPCYAKKSVCIAGHICRCARQYREDKNLGDILLPIAASPACLWDGHREACQRCGDPDGPHDRSEDGTASERNCALYRIGTQLEHLNKNLETLMATVLANLPKIQWNLAPHLCSWYPGEMRCRGCGAEMFVRPAGGS